MADKNLSASSLKDDIRNTIQEIRGIITTPEKKPASSGMGIAKDIIAGGTKMIAGGMGAIPTAVGKGLEQVPTLIGKGIGAEPVNPPDLGSNPSAQLAGEGYDQFAKGIGGAATATRSGVMSALNLKEAAPAPATAQTPAPTPAAPTASDVKMDNMFKTPVAQPNPAANVAGKNFGIQPKASVATPEAKPEGLKRWVDEAGVIHLEGQNLGIKKPEAKTPVSTGDIEKDIGTRINQLSNDPTNRTRDGGLRTSVQNEIGDLQKALLTAKVENFKTKEHAETNRIGREGIAESKKEALTAKKEQMFTNELKAFATKKMNAATGETDLDYTPYLFKVAMTAPSRVPAAFKADADAAVKRFDDFVSDWEKHPKSGKTGGKASAEERKGLYELYLNKLSQ